MKDLTQITILSLAIVLPRISAAQVDLSRLIPCQAALATQYKKMTGVANASSDVILPLKDKPGVVIFSGALAYDCPSKDKSFTLYKLGVNGHPAVYLESSPDRLSIANFVKVNKASEYTNSNATGTTADPRGFETLACDKTKTDQSATQQYLLATVKNELKGLKSDGVDFSGASLKECSGIYEIQTEVLRLKGVIIKPDVDEGAK